MINNEWVLTAAHCVQQMYFGGSFIPFNLKKLKEIFYLRKNASTLFALLGAHKITVNEPTQKKIFASKIIIVNYYIIHVLR